MKKLDEHGMLDIIMMGLPNGTAISKLYLLYFKMLIIKETSLKSYKPVLVGLIKNLFINSTSTNKLLS